MSKTYTIAIPMAGLGTRMRPHTHSKPKPLIPVAGRTVLDYALAQFTSLPRFHEARFVFIHSPGQREQVEAHMAANHSCIAVDYVLQAVMKGQSDALYLARELLHGPMLMAFSDTLIETDLGFLDGYTGDGIAWVKPVPDPTRFGVAQVDGSGHILRLIEKPKTKENNLALVGFYFFKEGQALMRAIEEQVRRGTALNHEYFLADAVNVMIEQGARFEARQTEVWLDAGKTDALLETNRALLAKCDNSILWKETAGVAIISPVWLDPSVTLENAVIGPYVSAGAGAVLRGCVVSDSILDAGAQVENAVLSGALLGKRARLSGQPKSANLGDDASAAL